MPSSNIPRYLFGGLITTVTVVLCLAICIVPAGAQDGQFKEDRDVEEPDAKVITQFRQMVRNGGISDNIFNQVLNYKLNSFSFPEKRGELPKMRQELVRFLQTSGLAEDATAHKRMQTRVLQVMTAMIEKEYHPFVRVNAMLVLGELNSKEPPLSFRDPPVPHPEALKVMLKAVNDPAQADAVRAAGLIGIGRHAQLGVSDEALNRQVRQAAEKLTAAEYHQWIRRQAINVLGHVGEMGRDGEIANMLMKFIADESEPMSIRCAAAEAFGSLDFSKGPKVQYKLATQMLAKLTTDAVTKANPNGGAWTDAQLDGLRAQLVQIEVGIKGRPDPTHRPTFNDPEPTPVSGMLLVLGQGNEQRKPLDELTGMFNELLAIVFNDKEFVPNELEYTKGLIDKWLAANPVEDRTLVAGKDPLPG